MTWRLLNQRLVERYEEMPRYSKKQKAALESLMRDDVHANAIKIITDDSFESLTMERLASAIGVSRGTLYNYFDDRDTVMEFVIDTTFGPLLTAVEEISRSSVAPSEKLTRIAHGVFSAIYDDRALVVALAPYKSSKAGKPGHDRRREAALAAIEAVIRECISDGTYKDVPPRLTAVIFYSAISGLVETMEHREEFLAADEIVPTFMQIFHDGLCNPS